MFGWSIVRVDGDSMSPTLHNGDYLIVRKRRGPLTRGTVVIIQHPSLGVIVKRVQSRDQDGRYRVSGDNTLSTASEHLGSIEDQAISAVVRWKVSPSGLRRVDERRAL